jgi:hypothetical protein
MLTPPLILQIIVNWQVKLGKMYCVSNMLALVNYTVNLAVSITQLQTDSIVMLAATFVKFLSCLQSCRYLSVVYAK